MAHENKEKRLKRKFISLEDKIQILNRLRDGEKPSSVGKSLNLNEATIRTIQKNGNKIRKSVAEGRSFDAKRVSRTRDIDMIRMENALMLWAEDCLNKKVPLSGTVIRQKALTIYKHLKQIGRSSTKPQTQSFTASKANGNTRLCTHTSNEKKRNKSQLSVFWQSNNKTWMSEGIFEDWFTNCFVPSVQNHMKEQNLDFKVLLLVDNAPSHSTVLNHPNVKIVFFPVNCASLIQPLDQGIIHTIKAHYLCQTFEVFLNRLDNDNNKTLIQIWKEFSILDCLKIISSVCKEIKTSTLNASWKFPQMVKKENAISSVDLEYTGIIIVASHLDGEGLADMNIKDVGELFQEETLSEEDLMEFINKPISNVLTDDNLESTNNESVPSLSLNDVQRGIDLGKQLELYFIEKDPLVARSGKFKRDLQSCLAPYKEILTILQNANTLVPTSNSFATNDKSRTSNGGFQPIKKKRN